MNPESKVKRVEVEEEKERTILRIVFDLDDNNCEKFLAMPIQKGMKARDLQKMFYQIAESMPNV